MGKRQAIGSMGGPSRFEGQNLNQIGWPDIIFNMGMGRQDLSNNQIGWECFNRTHIIIEHYWTELYRVEPHDPVSDPVFFAEARRRMAVEPTTTGIHSGLRLHRATRLWHFGRTIVPNLFPFYGCHLMSWLQGFPRSETWTRVITALLEPWRCRWISKISSLRQVAYGTYSVYILNVINC